MPELQERRKHNWKVFAIFDNARERDGIHSKNDSRTIHRKGILGSIAIFSIYEIDVNLLPFVPLLAVHLGFDRFG